MFKRVFKQLAVGVAFGAFTLSAHAADITGAGASFPYPIYAKWASDYKAQTGNQVNYQSIGSGGGQQQIIAKTVDFGASDDPLNAEKLQENNLLQFPAVIGGTVAVVNIDGVQPGQLKLSGQILGDIFLGKIKKWNDPAIAALNSGVTLPNADIVVVHRSDGSGTTFGWTNYLSKVNADWKSQVGEGKAVKWPVGQGGKGNEGVANYVGQLKNSIGYVEYAYAKQNNLAWTQLQNAAGKFVQPEQKAFAAAAAYADWDAAPGMGVVLTNQPGDDSWPVTAATFILVQKTQDKPAQGKAVLEFFDWAFKNGQESASALDYVPLPEAVTGKIRTIWAQEIKAADGAAIWK
ncbi:phosphate ABC transporter substrate-binding protein PstS [Kerstersia gyiorum]|jgi:phosphate transport system substrate-binding protein|uniref:Phosphate-binding protein PstS n=1 Tax=Kerstersia gyiorum TaxID=206506 RepID=A0A171KSR2_9BURK|nr:phosphate ABC transporter substrate-binding protein PstS [Kerstersia gyiorum]AZV94259.1 phosphate ABC transporter substrate-binding protein PstS [Bordetella sp. J329]MCO7638490.1 phosphate ABC transporter substrate-binding protein PstS [Pseudomonas sp. S 311-6]KAB0542061.1 phosphate ABC transporter substrate-binding protein PstS [Kerstersia gyiorum]KKO71929.1 phosphate ABC transporter substrate-binding protein [Kerstersia gyiorum]MCH4271749.1 phosphate ABC transporter substrate-binding prot